MLFMSYVILQLLYHGNRDIKLFNFMLYFILFICFIFLIGEW
jgi:hypothetical protein